MIWDIRSLYKLDPRHARQIWHQLEGERFIRALRGDMTGNSRVISSVSVNMGSVLPISQRSGELFLPLKAAEQSRNEKLAAVVDRINHRYKTRVIKYGNHQEHFGFFENG